jgi:hypothetical protein
MEKLQIDHSGIRLTRLGGVQDAGDAPIVIVNEPWR